MVSTDGSDAEEMVLVLNFTSELRALASNRRP
jgi:hypothetical protein